MKFYACKSEGEGDKCTLLLRLCMKLYTCVGLIISNISNINGVQCTIYNERSVYLILMDDNVNRTIQQIWNQNTEYKVLPNGVNENEFMVAVSGARCWLVAHQNIFQ